MGRIVPLGLLAAAAALFVGCRAARMEGGDDGVTLYYGSRCVLAGRNPYPEDALMQEWARDRQPCPRAPHPPFRFVNPPSLALLLSPIATLPWRTALPAIGIYSFGCALICIVLLCALSRPAWPWSARLLFATYVLLLPPLMRVLYFGQSTLIVCAPLAAALFALSRRRPVLAGSFLGLSLAKFTLSLPFVLALAYRRQWKAAATAVGVFLALNAVPAARVGVPTVLSDYRAAVSATVAPGNTNDPAGSELLDNETTMVHAERLAYMVFGPPGAYRYEWGSPERAWPTRAYVVFLLAAWALLAVALRPGPERRPVFEHPLDVGLAMAAALTLFYHRYYDLAALMFVAYSLVDYRLRHPERQRGAWTSAAVLTLAASFLTSGTGPSSLVDECLLDLGLHRSGCYNPLLIAALFGIMLWMRYRDARISDARGGASSAPGEPGAA